ncbi:MAG TPA: YggS family pyridoxal phosphate-dependent enzyme [Novosphingobium sp.]|nr:YggS family pyridoxal phosphate-dependent enzyme [Novosphingobium sp.]
MIEPATPLEDVQSRIAAAARIARRDPQEMTLIAISKTHPAEVIRPLLEQGQRVYGENRVQEAAEKWPALREDFPDVELHLVGQLQSNKTEEAVALFDCIHSLDRSTLLAALAKAMDKTGRRVPCFVQVNIGAEEQKGGCAIADLPALLAEVRAADFPLAGLMCVPPAGIEPAPFFALLAKLADDHGIAGLSMGMSDDFETAIMQGATHVRVGSALFGARGARPLLRHLPEAAPRPASG